MPYGGSDSEDNSGIIRYVRVEYSGGAADASSENNGFSFYGVGSSGNANFTLKYKFHFSNKSALRLVLSTTTFKNTFWGTLSNDVLQYQIDSVKQVYYNSYHNSSNRPQINIGIERKKQLSKNTSLFFGIDLVYAFQKETYEEYQETWAYDSTKNEYSIYENRQTQNQEQLHTNFIGLSPFFGLKHNFGKHFVLSGNFNINFTKTYGKWINYRYSTTPSTTTQRFSHHEEWTNGLISDLSISYRF